MEGEGVGVECVQESEEAKLKVREREMVVETCGRRGREGKREGGRDGEREGERERESGREGETKGEAESQRLQYGMFLGGTEAILPWERNKATEMEALCSNCLSHLPTCSFMHR